MMVRGLAVFTQSILALTFFNSMNALLVAPWSVWAAPWGAWTLTSDTELTPLTDDGSSSSRRKRDNDKATIR
jgi:hypothetical protein